MTTQKCAVCNDHQYTDFMILPGETQAMCPWCVYGRYEKMLARIETLETELNHYKRNPVVCFRCEAVDESLETRCVRRAGHALKHAFPNRFMKRQNRELWEALQHPQSTLNVDELGDRLAFDFVDPDPGDKTDGN